jgi:RHS repeat-associated protein
LDPAGPGTVTAGTAANYTWTYDRWGNRTAQTPLNGGQAFSASVNTANNQLDGYTYDAAGNMTNDGTHSYTYDAEGNITAVDGGATQTNVYDALNHRVRTVVRSAVTEFVFNQNGQRVSTWKPGYYQLAGQTYWGAKPVEFYAASVANYQHQDWLGTERLRTTYTGAVEGSYQSLPYGDGQTSSGADYDAYHFAALDADYASGTDNAQFRQYSPAQGRWMRPDPYSGSYDPGNPQSFNRYSYVLNNPLSYVDPSGLYCMWDDGTADEEAQDGGDDYATCMRDGGTWMDTTSVTVDGGDPSNPGITIENGEQIYPITISAPSKGLLHSLVCGVFSGLVNAADPQNLNSTIGVGIGGNAGVGFILGVAASAGVQVVADSSGNLGVAINVGGNPGYGVFGVGAMYGGQASVSTASTIYDLRGGSYDFGASGGAGPAYGVDVSGGDGGFTGTVTVGAGVGGKGSALTGVYTFVPSALSTNCR